MMMARITSQKITPNPPIMPHPPSSFAHPTYHSTWLNSCSGSRDVCWPTPGRNESYVLSGVSLNIVHRTPS